MISLEKTVVFFSRTAGWRILASFFLLVFLKERGFFTCDKKAVLDTYLNKIIIKNVEYNFLVLKKSDFIRENGVFIFFSAPLGWKLKPYLLFFEEISFGGENDVSNSIVNVRK